MRYLSDQCLSFDGGFGQLQLRGHPRQGCPQVTQTRKVKYAGSAPVAIDLPADMFDCRRGSHLPSAHCHTLESPLHAAMEASDTNHATWRWSSCRCNVQTSFMINSNAILTTQSFVGRRAQSYTIKMTSQHKGTRSQSLIQRGWWRDSRWLRDREWVTYQGTED